MRSDEADTFINFASSSLWNALSNYSLPNNHILNSVLINISIRIFGIEPWAIRMPACIAGIAIISLTWLAMRRFVGDAVGLFAAALVSISPVMIDFSVNARGYTLATVIFLVQLLLVRNLGRDSKIFSWISFCIAGAAGLWVVPTYLFCLTPIFVYLLWREYSRNSFGHSCPKLWQSGLLTFLLTLLVYSPVLLSSGWQALSDNSFVKATTTTHISSRLLYVPNDFALLIGWGFPEWINAFFVISSLGASLFIRKLSPELGKLIICVLVCAVLLIFLKHRIPPQRTWFLLLPIGYSIIGLGINLVARACLRDRYNAGTSGMLAIVLLAIALVIPFNKLLHFSNRTGRALGCAKTADEIVAHKDESPAYIFSLLSYGAPLKYYFIRNGGANQFKVVTHHEKLASEVDFIRVKQILVIGKSEYSIDQFKEHHRHNKLPMSALCMRRLSKHEDMNLYVLSFEACPEGQLPLEKKWSRRL